MSERPTLKDLHVTEEFSRKEDWNDLPSGAPDGVSGIQRFWGKYPGVVMTPIDPEMRCRLLVSVPDVWGPNVSSWALPCLPYAGLSIGMYIVPPIGANVWVEFLHGNPDVPIWSGFWFGSVLDAPKTPALGTPGAPVFGIETILKHAVIISDTPVPPFLLKGGILLRSGASYIAIEPTGVRIFGIPPQGVQVNGTPEGVPLSAALHVI
jgi:hypothetical protein